MSDFDKWYGEVPSIASTSGADYTDREIYEIQREVWDYQQKQIDSLKQQNELLREGLKYKPTSEMKAELIGEFSWNDIISIENYMGETLEIPVARVVPWITIKEIYKALSEFTARETLKKVDELNKDKT